MKFRTLLLGLSALAVAACAAYFSVLGLSKLFAGESLLVIIMAGSLELAKLVSAGFIYNYWEKLNKLLKGYLTVAVVILMLITSAGIYGFLTSAYKATSDELDIIDKQTEVIELKKERYSEELANYNDERNQLNQSISELSKGLANNVIQYKDEEGNIITTTSSATRKTLTVQLDDFKKQRDNVTEKIDVLNDSITSLDLQILDLKANNEVAAEIGPLRYISDITGKDMDTVVNWFALFIVLVFDPLAVTLVIAFNAAMKIDKGEREKKKIQSSNEYEVYNGKKPDRGGKGKGPNKTEPTPEPEPIVTGSVTGSGDMEITGSVTGSGPLGTFTKYELKFGPEFTKMMDGVQDEINQESQDEPDSIDTKDDIVRIQGKTRAEYEAGAWRQPFEGKPYYHHPWFDWNKSNRWIQDKHAVEYWMKFRGGNPDLLKYYRGNYPDNFDQKIY